jgi:3-oxoacyl-[acyl-carrier protein] reductase
MRKSPLSAQWLISRLHVRFEGRTALVTGASRGIGRAIALQLASEGANVVINYNTRADAAEEVAAAVRQCGAEAHVVQADVAVASDVDRLVQQTVDTFKRVDVLVNNAGITRDTLIMRMSEDDWDAVINTNLKSAFLVTKAVLRPMLRQRAGRIVNIASISGVIGNAGQANYSASKAGLLGLTRTTAREVASRNVTCNAVAAGVIDTEIWHGVPQEAIDSLMHMVPAGRKGTPEDVAQAVAFLASDAAGYITGQVLNVDGGLVMA